MEKLLLFSPDAATPDTVSVFKARGFSCVQLTDKASFFWESLNGLDPGGKLALLSHGDENGPLLVKGQAGLDMTSEEVSTLGNFLRDRDITLYLLSCHTGSDKFFNQLANGREIKCAAPIGYAVVSSGAGICNIYSKEGSDFVGWKSSGGLMSARARKTTALQFN